MTYDFLEDNDIPDEIKSKMLLAMLKAHKSNNIQGMREGLLAVVAFIDECISLDKAKELK